jgi:cytosine deaminase
MRWTIPDGPFRLTRARVPGPLLDGAHPLNAEGFAELDLWVTGPRLSLAGPADVPAVDLAGAIVLPAFVDAHTHLDKGHIWPRKANPDGTFASALAAVGQDREANWSAEDVAARMGFALASAYAHGTAAIRTHLDSMGKQVSISWGVLREMRQEWAGRITLQAAALTPVDAVGTPEFENVAQETARSGGVLGTVTYPVPDIDRKLDIFFATAERLGLHADFHVDETADPDSRTLHSIAQAVLRTGYRGSVLCGHCCSISNQPDDDARATLDLVAEAGLNVVSLPMCNLYLQDRHGHRTPRWRGITMVHEMAARGTRVSFASDNTRDPFYAYGDLDMLEVMREAVRIGHLDHPFGAWPAAFSRTPAAALGIEGGVIGEGAPADFAIFPARRWTELLSRPHNDRQVIRAGRPITAKPLDYSVLDPLMEPR